MTMTERSMSPSAVSRPPSATDRAGRTRCSRPGAGGCSSRRATLEPRFADEDGSHAMAVLDAAGVAALARLALHTGGARQIRRLTDAAHVVFERGTPAVRRHASWVLALFAAAQGDRASALRWSTAPSLQDGRPLLPRFPVDVTDEVHLARIAMAA